MYQYASEFFQEKSLKHIKIGVHKSLKLMSIKAEENMKCAKVINVSS